MENTDYRFCEDITQYKRLSTRTVYVGNIPLGGDYPVRIQSMTNTDTGDTKATSEQIKRIADNGADFVRMTTRTIKEAENLQSIKQQLQSDGYSLPLVADVHFNPKIAETAAKLVEKVRINPGNYSLKHAQKGDFKEIKENFVRLINICKTHKTTIRIGVNHGSLSQRIMDEHGDTPKGMVESAMEFLRICEEHNFYQVVVSLKSSNTRVMVQANRLLVNNMLREGIVYPLHLGVTEAGEGEDGRIKSAVGIGALLADGIGDTIRVSLTEAPEKEIPVAKTLADHFTRLENHESITDIGELPLNPFEYSKRETTSLNKIGGNNDPIVVSDISNLIKNGTYRDKYNWQGNKPDMYFSEVIPGKPLTADIPIILPYEKWIKAKDLALSYPAFYSYEQYSDAPQKSDHINFIFIQADQHGIFQQIKSPGNIVFILRADNKNYVATQRRFLFEMIQMDIKIPVILQQIYQESELDALQIKASAENGPVFVDGLAEGVFLQNRGDIQEPELTNLSLGILQASRIRIFKTEFISCPGCGRTQFDLEEAVKKVRRKTGHLKGLKIAVMGCVVNGPGEMADADYGYVGAGRGKVYLYKNKTLIKKNIPEKEALDELVELIKASGDWKE